MHLLALVLAATAAVAFGYEFVRSRYNSLVAFGLAVLTVAWIVQACYTGTERITFG